MTAWMAARTASTEGDAKISPQTAAVSMPAPTYPACAGSWPLPPPAFRVCDVGFARLGFARLGFAGFGFGFMKERVGNGHRVERFPVRILVEDVRVSLKVDFLWGESL